MRLGVHVRIAGGLEAAVERADMESGRDVENLEALNALRVESRAPEIRD